MKTTLGVVQACYSSERFAQLASRWMPEVGMSLLEWVARRATDCQQLDRVVILSCSADVMPFVHEAAPHDVPVIAVDGDDALARMSQLLGQCQADNIVRIRGDNPFVDPQLIDQLIIAANEVDDLDYATFCVPDGTLALELPVGICSEWATKKAILRANQSAKRPAHSEDIFGSIRSRTDKYNCLNVELSDYFADAKNMRLSVDTEDDWEAVSTLLEQLDEDRRDIRTYHDEVKIR